MFQFVLDSVLLTVSAKAPQAASLLQFPSTCPKRTRRRRTLDPRILCFFIYARIFIYDGKPDVSPLASLRSAIHPFGRYAASGFKESDAPMAQPV